MSKKVQKKARRHAPRDETIRAGILERAVRLLERHAVVLAVSLVLIASVRIVATYWVFNHVVDEPAHISSGLEYLSRKTYSYDWEHPPLARAMAALGLYVAGERLSFPPGLHLKRDPQEGMGVLYQSGHYERNLALARLGVLPFFWLACAVLFLWTARYFGRAAAVIAVLLFTLLPPVLAHAGLATTDMALTVFVPAGFLTLLFWAERPSALRSVGLGAVVGLGELCKFSMVPFLAAATLMALAAHYVAARPAGSEIRRFLRSHLPSLALAVVVCLFVIWGGYRFSYGMSTAFSFRVPAPEMVTGMHWVMVHNRRGHASYLLGQAGNTGWWYYYPVALAVKTPLPVLLLLSLGTALCIKRRAELAYRLPAALAVGILGLSLFSRINIGVRHVLPVYGAVSIMAANAVLWLVERSKRARWPGWALAVLLVWLAAAGARQHPDYLAYFNELVGKEPEKVLVDSDLDWGQDLKRLGQRLQELGATHVYLAGLSAGVFPYLRTAHGFPPILEIDPKVPLPGWTAISPTAWKALWPEIKGYRDTTLWVDYAKPRERVGSILLFYVPPPQPSAQAPPAQPGGR
jgi:hypothetical protein